jgi:hypothetical protein
MSRLAVSCAVLLSVTTLAAACSVYDEGLLGAGGDDTSSTRSGDGDGDGDGDGGGRGGAGPTSTSDGSTTTSDASTSSDASTGQSGSVTTGDQCQTPDDCPGVDSECSHRSCEGNQCSIFNEEAGVVLGRQTDGDCIVQVCDGQGNVTSDVDDDDVPDATEECIIPLCNNGVPGEMDAGEGAPCGDEFYCTAAAACVECLDDSDCDENCSEQNTCVAADCDDGEQNGDETDTDCGGPLGADACARCLNGDSCNVGTDCVSGSCSGTCQASCSDGILNNDETGIDCGGGECDQCVLGSACGVDTDCDSDQCLANVCRPRLFFSEYVKGESAVNKAVEIFNYGNVPVDLGAAACFVRVYFNGSTNATANIALTGSVAEFETHQVCNTAFVPACSAGGGGQVAGSLTFNGDDTIVIDCGGVVLDVFGEIGFDPGTAWGTGSFSTTNNTLRRNGGITEGDRIGSDDFVPSSEWTGFGPDVYAGLGDHP